MSGRSRSAARATRQRRTRWALVAAVAALLALGGILFLPIDGDGGGSSLPAVEVAMTEYAYAPDPIEAAAGQELAIRNDGAIVHSLLVVELAKGVELQPGGANALVLPDDVAAGSYRVICDIPGHVEQGMVTTLVVS